MADNLPSESLILVIDGSHGEGGGQIVRNAATFAAIFKKEICIINIRAGRSKPGLSSQHLTALNLLAEACGGSLEGGQVGSQEVIFKTNATSQNEFRKEGDPKKYTGDTKTAGSICLLLQALIPYALFAQDEICWLLRGGTNASMAPQYDYWYHIFWPTLREGCGLSDDSIQPKLMKRGFFPRGGGEVQVTTRPSIGTPLTPIQLNDRGECKNIWIRSFYAGKCPKSVAECMATAAENHVKSRFPSVAISTTVVYEEPAVASGSGILLVATTTTGCRFGGSALGSPKTSPHDMGVQAASELCITLKDGGCVDEYLQDQLILYMALAAGASEILTGSLSLHTQTAIWTAEQFCDARFHVSRVDDGSDSAADATGRIAGRHVIRCDGIGFLGSS